MSYKPIYWILNPLLNLPAQVVCIDCKKGIKCRGNIQHILPEYNNIKNKQNIYK